MSTRRKSAHASMLHLWDFMSTPEFIAFAHAQYGWLRCPATATLYSALSGDVYGELLPPHGEHTERQRVECVGFMREFVNGCRI